MCTYVARVLTAVVASTVSCSFAGEEPSWLAPDVGPFTPSLHISGAVGASTGEPETLAVGHHDPTREDGSIQGVEAGLSMRVEQLEGFATHVTGYGAEEEWENEWEEAFLKLKEIPGGFEVRGGRMLGRFGQQNAKHLHAWNFVDMPLPIGLFLGEHGLWAEGGDVTWLNQGISSSYGISLGYGDALEVDHGHGEHAEEHQAEAAGEDGHEEDHHAEEHEHGELVFHDGIFNTRGFIRLQPDDFIRHEAGFSTATGEEEAGRELMVFGLDYVFGWRENGLEPSGQSFTWTTELMYRELEKGKNPYDEDGEMLPIGGEFGFYTEAVWGLTAAFDAAGRVDYVQGNRELESDSRYRMSPALTYYPDPFRRTAVRLQYNYDDIEHHENEHTAWLQIAMNWGGTEVR